MSFRDLDTYRMRYPELIREMVSFFSISNLEKHGDSVRTRTIGSFLQALENKNWENDRPQPAVIDAICQSLVRSGYMSFAGSLSLGNIDGLRNSYVTTLSEENIDHPPTYRRICCSAFGLPCVYEIYSSAVIPIVNTSKTGIASVGTGFVFGPRILLTAAHCVDDAVSLSIRGVPAKVLADAIVSYDAAADIAALWLPEPVFEAFPSFRFDEPRLLQDVMAMGYPVVSGFLPTLAAEKAIISSRLTPVVGAIASKSFEIFAKSELLLITARVKGGFSGGPVVNQFGDCVGIVARTPENQSVTGLDDAVQRYDNLGYGTVVPSDLVRRMLERDAANPPNERHLLDISKTIFEEFCE